MRTDRGLTIRLTGDEIAAQRLDHAYAVTVHRAQGATVDRAHVLAEGGGRELAYVAMSRARETTHVHLVADDMPQAADDLRAEWSTERRQRWVLDVDQRLGEGERAQPHLDRRAHAHQRAAILAAERDALARIAPPMPPDHSIYHRSHITRLEQQLGDLRDGRTIDRDTPLGEAARERQEARTRRATAQQVPRDPNLGWRNQRHWRSELATATRQEQASNQRYDSLTAPLRAEIEAKLDAARRDLADHPEHDPVRDLATTVHQRVRTLDREITALEPPSRSLGRSPGAGISL